MISRLVVGLGVVVSLVCGGQAFAVTIPATDLDTWLTGGSIGGPLTDDFDSFSPPGTIGSIENEVFYDGVYTYTHEVTPSVNNNILFSTGIPIAGFTGIAGYSFSQSGAAGGAGSGLDFDIMEVDGFLAWVSNIPDIGWDSGESITFFYTSNNRPGMGQYNLAGFQSGTAQSFAPVPEPGSIALLGSGLVGLYAAVRRRRQQRQS